VDRVGLRVGEPDLLVRHGDGYLPVDVKSHKSLVTPKEPGEGAALVSDLADPYPTAAVADHDHDPRRHLADLLQLAHYRRLLEASGHASSTGNLGGIYGTEGVIVWYDLDDPWLDRPEYLAVAPAGPLSAMERYDLEFDHRLDVYAAAEAHLGDGSVRLLAEPIVCEQCDLCRWRDWCGERLEEVADLSLITGIGVARRRLYKANGIDDLHALAALDWTTAELCRSGVDFDDLLDKVRHLPGWAALAAVIPNRAKQLEALHHYGLEIADDLRSVDLTVVRLSGLGASNLAKQIELARARTGDAPAYRRRGIERIEVPRADVEVDVDMENSADGCYLWGALVTDRRHADVISTYVPFATWDPDLQSGELDAFARFWSWLREQRAEAAADGATFRAYCYYRSAEEGQLTRIAERLGLSDEVDAFLSSEVWVDLYEVVREHLITGRSLGLKQMAPLAGFAWSSGDAGGTSAMVMYDTAVDDANIAAQAEAREWILTYNEDDVRATAMLREWLDGPANRLPSIAPH
jgi:predicted RecB family nuclease